VRDRNAHLTTAQWPGQSKIAVKFSLTAGQVLHLLCIATQCNLEAVRSNQLTENGMTHEILTIRVAQALLSITATGAFVLALQFAMLTG
jgi:hypothetical protein